MIPMSILPIGFFTMFVFINATAFADDLPSAEKTLNLVKRVIPRKPARTEITDKVQKNEVVVKFREGSKIRLRNEKWVSLSGEDLDPVQQLLQSIEGVRINRMFSRPESLLDEERERGQAHARKELADLNLYFVIELPQNTETILIERFIDGLNALGLVEIAYSEPIPEPARADIPPTTPNFEANQGYLDPAPTGIDARYAWGLTGGRGEGMRFIDVEYGWRTTHEDLLDPFVQFGNNTLDNHGTAVLGEVVGDGNNGIGITGIVPLATYGTSSVSNQTVANAINNADAILVEGDVILIELHAEGPGTFECTCNTGQCRYIPMEFWQANFDAIAQATANNIIVVEAGGNGSMNLDDPIYNGAFNRDIRDSGAILVGARSSNGGAPMCWTNFGFRVDVSGWGENVYTLGYGDLFNPNDPNQRYTTTFSGTSSASPIIVGSVLAIQGVRLQIPGGTLLNPLEMRTLLVNTGTPQGSQPERHIGPMPNLQAALLTPLSWLPPILNLLLD